MARPVSERKPYSRREKAYIRRVAGKVPPCSMAEQLNRTKAGVLQWANVHGIKLRVPHEILLKHWPELVQKEKLQDIPRSKNGNRQIAEA